MTDQAGRKSARHVLRALIQGEDPATGKALEPGSVVHRLDVMRALALALEALEGSPAGTAQKEMASKPAKISKGKMPDRAGQGWERTDDEGLRQLFAQRRPVHEIAGELGRSRGAVAGRLVRLGLVKERGDS